MTSKKLSAILEAVILIAFGIVIAVCGPSTAVDIWFGVGLLIGGVVLCVLAFYSAATTKILPLGILAGSFVLMALGISLFTDWLTFGILIPILIIALIAASIALIVHGIYVMIVYKGIVYGLGEIAWGVLGVIFGILYVTVPDFRTAFWIIVGIFIAVLGVFYLILAIIEKDYKTIAKTK